MFFLLFCLPPQKIRLIIRSTQSFPKNSPCAVSLTSALLSVEKSCWAWQACFFAILMFLTRSGQICPMKSNNNEKTVYQPLLTSKLFKIPYININLDHKFCYHFAIILWNFVIILWNFAKWEKQKKTFQNWKTSRTWAIICSENKYFKFDYWTEMTLRWKTWRRYSNYQPMLAKTTTKEKNSHGEEKAHIFAQSCSF